MSCYKPKRKTASGVEEVTLPIASIQGLQTELDDLGNKTIDRVDYLSVMAPEPAMQFYNTDAGAHIGEEGIAYNTLCEISSDINDSEVTYTFPMSTHIPILPGENISFSDNEEGTAIKINASPAMPCGSNVQALAYYMTARPTQYIKTSGSLVKKQLAAIFDCHLSQFPKGSAEGNSIRLYLTLRSVDFGLRSLKGRAEGFRVLGVTHMHCLPEAGK